MMGFKHFSLYSSDLVLVTRYAKWFCLCRYTAWVRTRLCKLQKRFTRLAAASDKVYQLLAHGRWFSPGTPASSTTKTGRHDISRILLKVALNTPKNVQFKHYDKHVFKCQNFVQIVILTENKSYWKKHK